VDLKDLISCAIFSMFAKASWGSSVFSLAALSLEAFLILAWVDGPPGLAGRRLGLAPWGLDGLSPIFEVVVRGRRGEPRREPLGVSPRKGETARPPFRAPLLALLLLLSSLDSGRDFKLEEERLDGAETGPASQDADLTEVL